MRAPLGSDGLPPGAGRLPRQRHHGVEQHESGDRAARGDDRHREAAHRLPDDHHVVTAGDRVEDEGGILAQTGGRIIAGKVDGKGLVAGLLDERHDAVPVPGGAAGAGDERECGHCPHASPRRHCRAVPR